MNKKRTMFIVESAVIAALYAGLTYAASMLNLAYGSIQFRFSEALTILACLTPAAIPGLFLGCFLSNVLGGCIIPDIIFGSLATLLGAIGTYALRGQNKFLAPTAPILANAMIEAFVLRYGYHIPLPIPFMMLTVGIGEVISCGVLGMILWHALNKYRYMIFKTK